jgi:hypothetical protein
MDWLQINVGVRDTTVVARLMEDYVRDLQDRREVTLPLWQQRLLREKVAGPFVWILERQQ